MAKQHLTTRQRVAAVKWWRANGRNVSATCRRYGIARSTFYRWLERFDPKEPGRSLRRRRRTVRVRPLAPKEALFIKKVVEMQIQNPRLGRRRIRRALLEMRDDAPSEATIGRWLSRINRGCPVCGGRNGLHVVQLPMLNEDLSSVGVGRSLRPLRRSSSAPSAGRTVQAAEALLLLRQRQRQWRQCSD